MSIGDETVGMPAEGARRALLAWELGSGRGHAARLLSLAGALGRAGWAVAIAANRTDLLADAGASHPGIDVFQAPVWPGQLAARAPRRVVSAVTFGDVLAEVGLGDPDAVAGVVGAWQALYRRLRPDLIVADTAPGALLAARTRIRTMAVGTGFTVPPAGLDAFPLLRDGADRAAFDPGRLLDAARRGAARAGAALPERLPDVMAADDLLPATFAELDPYGPHRPAPPCRPTPPYTGPPYMGPPYMGPPASGEEVFVYGNELIDPRPWLLPAARAAGAPVRAFVPGLPAAVGRELAAAGIRIEPNPVPLAEIASRSRLVVSHGPLGLTSAVLGIGLPQLLLPFDLEKRLNAAAVTRLGCGRIAPLAEIARSGNAERLFADALADPRIAGEAAAWSLTFNARIGPDLPEAMLERLHDN